MGSTPEKRGSPSISLKDLTSLSEGEMRNVCVRSFVDFGGFYSCSLVVRGQDFLLLFETIWLTSTVWTPKDFTDSNVYCIICFLLKSLKRHSVVFKLSYTIEVTPVTFYVTQNLLHGWLIQGGKEFIVYILLCHQKCNLYILSFLSDRNTYIPSSCIIFMGWHVSMKIC